MVKVVTILLMVALVAVVAVLVTGVVTFARGGEFHRRHGHRLMTLRVATQALAVLLLGLLLLLRAR